MISECSACGYAAATSFGDGRCLRCHAALPEPVPFVLERGPNLRAIAWRATAVAAMLLVSWTTWKVTTPGEITFTEFRLTLLTAAPCLIITLCVGRFGR